MEKPVQVLHERGQRRSEEGGRAEKNEEAVEEAVERERSESGGEDQMETERESKGRETVPNRAITSGDQVTCREQNGG